MISARTVSSIAALMLAAAAIAHAQEPGPDPRPSAGAFWSANFSSVSLAPAADGVEGRQFQGAGVSVEVALTRGLALDGRVFWNRRGARLPTADPAAFRDLSTDYISMPLLITVARPGRVRPYAVGGVEVGLRTRARIRTLVGGLAVEEDASSRIRRADLALDAGVGLERALPKARVFVEALYAHGLRNVTPDDSGAALRTRTLTLSAGLRF